MFKIQTLRFKNNLGVPMITIKNHKLLLLPIFQSKEKN